MPMQFVNYETVDENIVVVTLNRPEAANALSLALLTELEKCIQKNQSLRKNSLCNYNWKRGEGFLCRS